MSDYEPDDQNDGGRTESNNQTNADADADLLTIERNDEYMGALELEYPGAAIYRDIFDRHLPEIADWLVTHRCVRFLTEVAYNTYIAGEMLFDAPGVTEQMAYTVLAMAERLTNLLERVCVQMASVYRAERRYPPRGEL